VKTVILNSNSMSCGPSSDFFNNTLTWLLFFEWAPKKEKKHGTDNDGRTQIPFAKSFHAVSIDHFEPVTYALHIERFT